MSKLNMLTDSFISENKNLIRKFLIDYYIRNRPINGENCLDDININYIINFSRSRIYTKNLFVRLYLAAKNDIGKARDLFIKFQNSSIIMKDCMLKAGSIVYIVLSESSSGKVVLLKQNGEYIYSSGDALVDGCEYAGIKEIQDFFNNAENKVLKYLSPKYFHLIKEWSKNGDSK